MNKTISIFLNIPQESDYIIPVEEEYNLKV